MVNQVLVGVWKLVSYEIRLADEQVIYPFGEDAIGYLMYTENGYMSVNLMSANCLPFTAESATMASLEEILMAIKTFFAYCGKYEVFTNKVIHYPEVSNIPNLKGLRQERTFEIMDNCLCLTFNSDDMQATFKLIWERV